MVMQVVGLSTVILIKLYLYSITKDDIGQLPSDHVCKFNPIQLVFRESKSVSDGPESKLSIQSYLHKLIVIYCVK